MRKVVLGGDAVVHVFYDLASGQETQRGPDGGDAPEGFTFGGGFKFGEFFFDGVEHECVVWLWLFRLVSAVVEWPSEPINMALS